MPREEGLVHRIMGNAHPVNEVRVERLKQELVRWETEKRAALLRQHRLPQRSSILLAAA